MQHTKLTERENAGLISYEAGF